VYVEDIDSIEECEELLAEVEDRINFSAPGSPEREQAEWDYEDLIGRLQELDPTAGTNWKKEVW